LEDKGFGKLIDLSINSTKHLIKLLDDMIAYSRSPDLLLTQRESINSSDLLLTVVSLLNVPDNFTIGLPSENHLMVVSAVSLQQILINLLTNAIRYNDKEQGFAQIRLRQDEGSYYFEVDDNGIGIPQKFHSRIFDTNFTLNLTDQKNKKGTGIGLSTVKELIKAVKGSISVQSDLGKGTTFSFSLPKN